MLQAGEKRLIGKCMICGDDLVKKFVKYDSLKIGKDDSMVEIWDANYVLILLKDNVDPKEKWVCNHCYNPATMINCTMVGLPRNRKRRDYVENCH